VERQQILALTHEVAPHYEVEIAQSLLIIKVLLFRGFSSLEVRLSEIHGKVDIALAHAVIRKGKQI
jgi:hypothetical protein